MEVRRVIVLDEQLKNANVAEQIRQWYQGRVVPITTLRPATVIKDDAIPILLRQVVAPTFVTINTTDFWQQMAASKEYCLACFPLTDDRVDEISPLLRRLFRFTEFKTKQARCGKIALVSHANVQYYQGHPIKLYRLAWPVQ